MVWGDGSAGACDVPPDLAAVDTVVANSGAVAALLLDGRVVTWGAEAMGGDSSQLALQQVRSVCATAYAFAAVKMDGTVVCWGEESAGGDAREVQAQLRGVRQIAGACWAFAAVLDTGAVVSWGDGQKGGDSREVQERGLKRARVCGGAAGEREEHLPFLLGLCRPARHRRRRDPSGRWVVHARGGDLGRRQEGRRQQAGGAPPLGTLPGWCATSSSTSCSCVPRPGPSAP